MVELKLANFSPWKQRISFSPNTGKHGGERDMLCLCERLRPGSITVCPAWGDFSENPINVGDRLLLADNLLKCSFNSSGLLQPVVAGVVNKKLRYFDCEMWQKLAGRTSKNPQPPGCLLSTWLPDIYVSVKPGKGINTIKSNLEAKQSMCSSQNCLYKVKYLHRDKIMGFFAVVLSNCPWVWVLRDGSDKQAPHNDNVLRRNLIKMGWMSFTNSGYFAVIYLCLPSGERDGTDGPVSQIK